MKYQCSACDYTTTRKTNWTKHVATKKHIINAKMMKDQSIVDAENINTDRGAFKCNACGKVYKYNSGLIRHKKTCIDINSTEKQNAPVNEEKPNKYEEIVNCQYQQIKDLQELLEKTMQTNKETINNLLPKVGNTTNNISNKLTINVFLNETCQNAMNITDFVDQLHLSLDDLKYTKDNGYVKGITNIFVKNLSDMPLNSRPIHCSDTEALEFYVKDKDMWAPDNNIKINKSIQDITYRQIQQIKEWEKEHPNWTNNEKETRMYMDTVMAVMGGLQEEEQSLEVIKKNIGVSTDINKVLE